MLLAIALVLSQPIEGGITFYYGEQFEGEPLYCGRYKGQKLTYNCETMPAWGAFPYEWYKNGSFQCGDDVLVTFSDGTSTIVKAFDACPGCLSARVWDTGRPFVADLPVCQREGRKTGTGTVFNLSAQQRLKGKPIPN
jgi:hypothetical protein